MKRSNRNRTGDTRVALRNMAAAGLRGKVVERCPAPHCEACSHRMRPAA
jgi:hypothetical protein